LRQIPLPTIDPEDARDHDDAVWVERHGEGYRAWIAIADVSEFVQPGSELDEEALSRGCTVYLPTRAIPMLPTALAADLCSLLPERERLCLCVIADLDNSGVLTGYEIVEGVMRSAAMLTYGGVARTLGFSDTPPKSAAAEAFKKDLKVMDELTRKLRKARMNRGALDMDLPEARVLVDAQTGAPTDVVRRAQDPGVKRAYSMIEELMLLANEAVALWLGSRKAPTVYRIHGQPDAWARSPSAWASSSIRRR
jgi:ribonuclease R